MSSGDGSGNGASVNENSFTMLFIISCVFGIVEAMGLLLGVCRLYSDDGVSESLISIYFGDGNAI